MRRMSKITDGLIGQPMFKLLARAIEMELAGRRIHHFEIGDSPFRAHQHILDATKQGLDQDRTHYVDSSGIPELKEAICDHTAETLGFRPASCSNKLTTGAQKSLTLLVRNRLSSG